MNRLFLRIFLWFWAVIALIVAILVATSPLFTRSRPGFERWEGRAFHSVQRVAAAVAERIERGRPADAWLRGGRRHHPPLTVLVLDEDLHDVLGRPVPDGVSRLAAEALEAWEARSERSGTLYLAAHPALTPEGRKLVVVAAAHRPPRPLDLLEPRFLLPRLAVLLLVVGLLTLLMARRLTAPLETLRSATRRLAAGELSARVGQPLTGRRDELGELARDFDAMAERLEELVGAQQRLIRDVSHELRSPLARLGVALELARRGDEEERREALDRIELEAGRLNHMIGQLLALSRLRTSGQPEVSKEVDLAALVDTVSRDAAFEARERGVSVEAEVRAGCTVTGSQELLRSALENVLRNAVRYSPAGSVVHMTLEVEDTGPGLAVITVADRGPGVPEKDLEHLFEPFFRTTEARDRASGGTGLGLAITEAAVRSHGGRVRATNRPGGGLEVRMELPCHAGREAASSE